MKTNRRSRARGLVLSSIFAWALPMSLTMGQTTDIPRGTLSVDRDLVRVGVRSNLAWDIQYPVTIKDIVTVGQTGTITPKKDLRMRVRTIGVAFQSGSTLLPLDAYWSRNGGSWTKFFYGIGTAVNSSQVLVDTTVKQSERIDFGARGWSGSSWLPLNHTRQSTQYVVVLGKGSVAPSYAPAYNQTSVANFLKPYIDAGGKINIGEKDLIILWEASTAKPGTTYFDMQDLVVLVSFE